MRVHQVTGSILAVLFLWAVPCKADVRAMRGIEQRSAALSHSYLRTWSSSRGASAAEVHRVYGPRVQFYGRSVNRAELVREKQRFVRRWPVRRFAHQPGTLRVACNGTKHTCTVKSVIGWKTSAPARRAVSAGSSKFEQRVVFTAPRSQPSVIYENGVVLKRNKAPRA